MNFNKFQHRVNISVLLTLLLVNSCTFDGTAVETHKVPTSPTPVSGSINQQLDFTLAWQAESATSFDVYFDEGINPPTTLAYEGITQNYIRVPNQPLNETATYYWKVVAIYDDGTREEGEVWNFTTLATQQDGYELTKYYFGTSTPNIVEMMFQVTDLYDRGITNMTVDNFKVLDDGDSLSPYESQIVINRRDQTPYEIRTVLMLDNSTSLSPEDIVKIRDAAANYINNILPEQKVAIYSFSDEIIPLKYEFSSDKNVLLDSLSAFSRGEQSTNLYGAAMEGASRWEDLYSMEEIVQGMMIVFTDGQDTQASHTLFEALNEIGSKMVFTIGLGVEIDPDILEEIGNSGFYPIDDIDQVTQKLTDIQTEIVLYANSFYWLRFYSPRRGNRNHMLTLSIRNNPYTGPGSFIVDSYNSEDFY